MQECLWALETNILAGNRPYSFATLADLAAWGIASEVLADLESLVARGTPELVVVASFLSALCHSQLRDQFGRSTRIKILAVAKASAADQVLVTTLTDALAAADTPGWHWRSLSLDTAATS